MSKKQIKDRECNWSLDDASYRLKVKIASFFSTRMIFCASRLSKSWNKATEELRAHYWKLMKRYFQADISKLCFTTCLLKPNTRAQIGICLNKADYFRVFHMFTDWYSPLQKPFGFKTKTNHNAGEDERVAELHDAPFSTSHGFYSFGGSPLSVWLCDNWSSPLEILSGPFDAAGRRAFAVFISKEQTEFVRKIENVLRDRAIQHVKKFLHLNTSQKDMKHIHDSSIKTWKDRKTHKRHNYLRVGLTNMPTIVKTKLPGNELDVAQRRIAASELDIKKGCRVLVKITNRPQFICSKALPEGQLGDSTDFMFSTLFEAVAVAIVDGDCSAATPAPPRMFTHA